MTYLLRSFSDDIRPYTENVSKSIVNLLVTCPDSISTRKVSPPAMLRSGLKTQFVLSKELAAMLVVFHCGFQEFCDKSVSGFRQHCKILDEAKGHKMVEGCCFRSSRSRKFGSFISW